MKQRWEVVRKELLSRSPLLTQLLGQESDRAFDELGKAINAAAEALDLEVRERLGTVPLLHDIHPHNLLIGERGIEVVIDYHWSALWSHERVLAYSIHRFTREQMRAVRWTPGRQEVRHAALSFCKSYVEGYKETSGRELSLHDSLATNLEDWIKLENAEKLISVGEKLAGTQDPYGRTRARIENEFRKFVTYMAEADQYAGALQP